uniref:Uncharacterized protein n=1 Tax=Rhizophora mucronata TaxID=61149 RepID=A0A2P2NLS4_RHIMU
MLFLVMCIAVSSVVGG